MYTAHPPQIILSTVTRQSIFGCGVLHISHGNWTWPAANRALFIPFRLSVPFLVKRLFWQNGNTTGSVDMGIYTLDGTLIPGTNIGSTSKSGFGSDRQGVNLGTPIWLYGGNFYWGMLCNNGSGTFYGSLAGANTTTGQTYGVLQSDIGSGTLPSSVTLAQSTQANIPFCGMTSDTGIP